MKRNRIGLLAVALWTIFAATRILANDDEKVQTQQPVEKSMHEFMEYVFQPTYKRLRTSMSSEPTEKSHWKAIKSDALILAESANLLFLRLPAEKAEVWTRQAAESRKHAAAVYRSAGSRDFTSARVAYQEMLDSCNACHRAHADGKYQLKP